jgi:hypothetical protein
VLSQLRRARIDVDESDQLAVVIDGADLFEGIEGEVRAFRTQHRGGAAAQARRVAGKGRARSRVNPGDAHIRLRPQRQQDVLGTGYIVEDQGGGAVDADGVGQGSQVPAFRAAELQEFVHGDRSARQHDHDAAGGQDNDGEFLTNRHVAKVPHQLTSVGHGRRVHRFFNGGFGEIAMGRLRMSQGQNGCGDHRRQNRMQSKENRAVSQRQW